MAISITAPAASSAGPVTLARQEQRFALALLAPALLLLLITTTIPLVYLAWNSMQRIDLGMPWLSGFAGLDNYAKMGSDPRFWSSLWLTLVYTASTVALQVVIGLSLALLVLQIPKGQGVLRIAAILPIVLAPVVVGLFWRTLVLAPDFGLVDLVTRSAGFGSYNWLGDPQLALISVIAIHTWQWTPFAFLVMLATLSTLPPDVYEAARLDRARPWQRFVYITLPLIRPAIVMVVIMRTMTALSASFRRTSSWSARQAREKPARRALSRISKASSRARRDDGTRRPAGRRRCERETRIHSPTIAGR